MGVCLRVRQQESQPSLEKDRGVWGSLEVRAAGVCVCLMVGLATGGLTALRWLDPAPFPRAE